MRNFACLLVCLFVALAFNPAFAADRDIANNVILVKSSGTILTTATGTYGPFRLTPGKFGAALDWNVSPASGTANASVSFLYANDAGTTPAAWTAQDGSTLTSNVNIDANGQGGTPVKLAPAAWVSVKVTNNGANTLTISKMHLATY